MVYTENEKFTNIIIIIIVVIIMVIIIIVIINIIVTVITLFFRIVNKIKIFRYDWFRILTYLNLDRIRFKIYCCEFVRIYCCEFVRIYCDWFKMGLKLVLNSLECIEICSNLIEFIEICSNTLKFGWNLVRICSNWV